MVSKYMPETSQLSLATMPVFWSDLAPCDDLRRDPLPSRVYQHTREGAFGSHELGMCYLVKGVYTLRNQNRAADDLAVLQLIQKLRGFFQLMGLGRQGGHFAIHRKLHQFGEFLQ